MSAADAPNDIRDHTPAPRRADFGRWQRHTRIIHGLRIALPVLMVAIALVLVGWVAWASRPHLGGNIGDVLKSIHMTNPRFQGRDSKGRAFTLSAREAVRDERNQKQVSLTDPYVSLGVDTATPTRLMADYGVYNEEDRMLRLNGNVRLDDGSGYRFASNQATVDTRKGELVGKEAMSADGPMGQVQAGSFAVQDKGKKAIFKGGVRARLNQH